jgi:DNA invertase Pin-like site-specific DNA recombinase
MADLLYLRHSTDKQTNARQLHALDELLRAGAPKYEDPATSSRVYAVRRAGFRQLLDDAAVADTVRIADAARLFRSTKDVIEIREVLQRRGLHLRIATGAWSGFDLAADDPQTKLFVVMLAGVLEFQRDMISENTREGVAAAVASGKTLGRPVALDAEKAADVVTAFREGAAIKALARQHRTSPKTIRRVLDAAGERELPDDLAPLADPDATLIGGSEPVVGEEATTPARPVPIDVPGLLVDSLQDADDPEIRQALRDGQSIRRGTGYSVRVTAPLTVHQAMLEHCAGLVAVPGREARRKAYRVYADRVQSGTS